MIGEKWPLGRCPEWYRVLKNAEQFGQHPADWIGHPETKRSAIWSNWAEAARVCEAEAREVLAERGRRPAPDGQAFIGRG